MSKNIILLSDGTGNSSHDPFKTNVWRLYQALDLNRFETKGEDGKDDPTKPDQVACYDDGVGTSSFQPLALLGGAFGYGLKRNVLDLYTYLCRNYKRDADNADGKPDRIYLFGFSRGAFTVRVLADLIAEQGLIPMTLKDAEGEDQPTSEADLQRLAAAAFRANRWKYGKQHKVMNLIRNGLRHVRDGAIRFWDKRRKRVNFADIKVEAHPDIAFVGVFDTVAAYGLPVDELTRAWDFIFPLSFPDQNLSTKVNRACHALALDDERHSFHPELWNEDEAEYPVPGTAASASAKRTGGDLHERLLQVWFAGMHSDVGGSYPDDAMSFVPLEWMLRLADDAGLRFKKRDAEAISSAANLRGPIHDSRRGVGGFYRYQPRKLANLLHDKDARVEVPMPIIHESVFERIRQGTDGYAPIVMPAEYAVYTRQGVILPQGEAVSRHYAKSWQSKALNEAAPDQSAKPDKVLSETREVAQRRVDRQEHIWNLVWKKRVVYFASVLTAFALALFPLYKPATAACEGPACFAAPLIKGLAFVLPGFATPLLKAYESHPGTFLPLLVAFIVLLAWGGGLQRRIFDGMCAIWAGKPLPQHIEKPEGGIFGFREHPLYQRWLWVNRHYILPNVAGLLAAWVIVGGVSHFAFTAFESAGCVCVQSTNGEEGLKSFTKDFDQRVAATRAKYMRDLACYEFGSAKVGCEQNHAATPTIAGQQTLVRPVLALPDLPGTFDPKSLCWSSGYWVEEGQRYKLTLKASPDWADASIKSDLGGFEVQKAKKVNGDPVSGLSKLGFYGVIWLRRNLGENWFKPFARIGQTGHDEYPLNPQGSAEPDVLVTEIIARRSGELYLFLNDAAWPLPNAWQQFHPNKGQPFYQNNMGTATVQIQRLDETGK